jgi:hypothetical protein
MGWEEQVDRVLADLEQQAEGLALAERDALVAEQRAGEYAAVEIVARFHASVGCEIRVQVVGLGAIDARLTRVGDGWLLLASARQESIVRLAAVTAVRGLSARAVGAASRPVASRLGLTSALRGVAADRAEVAVQTTDGSSRRGLIGRVGADFFEVATSDERLTPDVDLVPFTALAAVRSV